MYQRQNAALFSALDRIVARLDALEHLHPLPAGGGGRVRRRSEEDLSHPGRHLSPGRPLQGATAALNGEGKGEWLSNLSSIGEWWIRCSM